MVNAFDQAVKQILWHISLEIGRGLDLTTADWNEKPHPDNPEAWAEARRRIVAVIVKAAEEK